MTFIGDLVRGAMILSSLALILNSYSPRQMAQKAVEAHNNKGLTSYGALAELSQRENLKLRQLVDRQ